MRTRHKCNLVYHTFGTEAEYNLLIETGTSCVPFCRPTEEEKIFSVLCSRYFQIDFLLWQLLEFNPYISEKHFQWCNLQLTNIRRHKGLVKSRRHTIIQTNGSIVFWRTYASLSHDELHDYERIDVFKHSASTMTRVFVLRLWPYVILCFIALRWNNASVTSSDIQIDAHGMLFVMPFCVLFFIYRKVPNISGTKSLNLNASRLIL